MHLFHRSPTGSWLAHPLNGHQVAIAPDGQPDETLPSSSEAPLTLVPHDRNWLLLTSGDAPVSVNGHRVALGIVKLCDRDEIVSREGARLFFSTETQEKSEPFPGLETGSCICPRCRLEIAQDAPAVRCGICRVWEHAACWTYAPTCATCSRETSPDAGLTFNPEEL